MEPVGSWLPPAYLLHTCCLHLLTAAYFAYPAYFCLPGLLSSASCTPGEYRTFPVTFGGPCRESLCKSQSDIQETVQAFLIFLIPFVLWGIEGYRDELKKIKCKIRKKVAELMFSDYIHYRLI